MQYVQTLSSYLPQIIIQNLVEEGAKQSGQALTVPRRQTFETVCVFCDVSGFTALSEAMARNGKGAEGLAKHLNSYFSQMVKTLSSEGGDIFKFAGDAMIVLWPPSDEPMGNLLRRAAQCAIAIQKALHQADLEEGVQLSVKIGIGYGPVSVLHIGGVFNRTEYIAVGEPLLQAFNAEHHAVSGQVIISAKAWEFLKDYFEPDEIYYDDYVRLKLDGQFPPMKRKKPRNILEDEGDNVYLEAGLKGYVGGAVLGNLNPESVEDEVWGNETRRVAVIFVNLGLTEQHLLASALYNDAMEQVHGVLVAVQKSVYTYEGSVNKFLMDDKGSTLIACFGLPPLPHKDDSLRAVLASISICESLWKLGFKASIGITKGDVFCGIVGSKTRREYSILGDSVNLSARLMQRACTEGGGVICDEEVIKECGTNIDYLEIGQISVKGKSQPINVFRPYPQDLYENFDIKEKLIIEQNPYSFILQHQLITFENDRKIATVDGIVNKSGKMKSLLYSAPTSPSSEKTNFENTPKSKRPSALSLLSRTPSGNSVPPSPSPAAGKKKKSKSILSPSGLKLGFSTLATENDTSSQSLNSPSGARDSEGSISPLARRKSTATKKSDEENVFNHYTRIDYVEIMVPPNFQFDDLTDDSTIHLEKIPVSDALDRRIETLQDLHRVGFELAIGTNALPPKVDKDWDLTEIRLGIPNTHFFLPHTSNINVSYLGSYLACAMEDLGADISVYDKDTFTLKLYMISNSKMKTRQSRRGYVKSALTDAKLDLIENGTCKLIFLEGEAGVGKSKLLMDVLSNPPHDECAYYVASPSPFELLKPFACLVPIFKHYLEKRKGRANSDNSGSNLTALLLTELVENPYPENIETYPHVLNAILGTSVPEISLPDGFDIKSHQVLLLSWLLVCMGRHRKSILLADDGTYIDPSTWEVFHHFINRPTTSFYTSPFTIVIAHKTFYRHYTRLFPIPAFYSKLINATSTNYPVEIFKFDNMLQDEEANYIIAELSKLKSLNITSVSDNLFKLVDGKCQGNPYMIKEYLKLLNEEGELFVEQEDYDDDDDGEEDLGYCVTLKKESEEFKMSFAKIVESSDTFNLIPKEVTDMISPQLDRLNSCQTMILKTISFSRKEFELSFLMKVFPLESHKPNVKYEINKLEELGFLEGHRTTGAWRLKYKPDPKFRDASMDGSDEENDDNEGNNLFYKFNNTFVREVIKKRMLKEHTRKVKEAVDKEQRKLDVKRRQIFSAKFGESAEPMKEGELNIKKRKTDNLLKVKRRFEGSSWKSRYCELLVEDGQKMLKMFKDRPIRGDRKSHDEMITQVIFLDGARAAKDVSAKEKHAHSFVINAKRFMDAKHGNKTPVVEDRDFHFRCSDDQDLQDWIYMTQYLIELNDVGGDKGKGGNGNKKNVSQLKDMDDDDYSEEDDNAQFFTRPSNFTTSIMTSEGDADEEEFEEEDEEIQELSKSLDAVVHLNVNELRDVDDFAVIEYNYRPYVRVSLATPENAYSPIIKEGKVTSEKTHSNASNKEVDLRPIISEDIVIPIKFNNWKNNSIKVQVWNWDPQLSDDFIGECLIPTSEIERSSYISRSNSKTSDTLVGDYSLVKNNSQLVGSITLSVNFYLSPSRELQLESDFNANLTSLIQHAATVYEEERIHALEEERRLKEEEIKRKIQADMEARYQSSEDEQIKKQINELLTLSSKAYKNKGEDNVERDNNYTNSETVTNVSSTQPQEALVAEATRRLKSIIMCIRNREPICQPSEDHKAIDQQWIYNNLCSTLTILSPSLLLTDSTENLAFKELLDKADIKEQDREWLQMTYNKSYQEISSQDYVQSIERRISISKERRESVKNLHGFSSLQNLKEKQKASDKSSDSYSLASEEEVTLTEEESYFYIDISNKVQGPFPVKKILAWYYAGYLHEQVLLRKGGEKTIDGEENRFIPLSMHLDTMRSLPTDLSLISDLNDIIPKIIVEDDPTRQYWSWSFDVYQLEVRELFAFLWVMLEHLELPSIFNFNPKTFWNFISMVEHYMSRHKNPYHNFYHIVDVTHACFVMLVNYQAERFFNKLEIFTCLLAAMCHDLDHPGTNNMYQVNAGTPLAILYNDQSVLENHHGAVAFRIFKRKECNMIASLNDTEVKRFRSLFIQLILGTDMSFHFKLKAQFDDCVLRNLTPEGEEDLSESEEEDEDGDEIRANRKNKLKAEEITALKKEEDRDILLKTILHAADLSNPAKPWPISKAWSDRVVEEFFNQGDREKKEDLPISPNMDRDTTVQSELSINFADFIVAPAYVALTALIPNAVEAVICVIGNRSKWEDLQTQRLMTIYAADNTTDEEEREQLTKKRDEELARWGNRRKAFSEIVGDNLMNNKEQMISSHISSTAIKEMASKFYDNISLGIRRETGNIEENEKSIKVEDNERNNSDGEVSGAGVTIDRRKSLRVLEDMILATEIKETEK